MQDAELFFQAADHRHLFLFIDALAKAEARRQADVCDCAQKRLDDYAALQKKVKRLEQELQQEKDANALLQKQLAQQSRETVIHSSQKKTTEDKQARTAPARNNAEEWHRLGEQYAYGEGVPRDYGMACQCYAEAAAQGYKASLSVLIQLAEVGNADAQYRLGCMYRRGEGVPQDYNLARRWFKKAIAQRHADALNDFGEMY